jgi:hypothetical protein
MREKSNWKTDPLLKMEGNGKASASSSAFVYISVEQSVIPSHILGILVLIFPF